MAMDRRPLRRKILNKAPKRQAGPGATHIEAGAKTGDEFQQSNNCKTMLPAGYHPPGKWPARGEGERRPAG